eukprot:2256679-Rhodomonas_salina.2
MHRAQQPPRRNQIQHDAFLVQNVLRLCLSLRLAFDLAAHERVGQVPTQNPDNSIASAPLVAAYYR